MRPATTRWTPNTIEVKIGGKTVEVCCEECAMKLKEAHASAAGSREG